ncbi:MAG TPA: hypothetical protein PLN25_12015 [Deltaproteobacteria bacterium]|nr:hypothetical protein [Deltaproteobacteria bacterium]
MNIDAEISVKDIVNFYIKINDAAKAKKDIAQLSSKDKAAALDVVAISSATRDFKVEVAKYFVHDLDSRVRRKAEMMMEALVPGWVADPAESILKLLTSGSKSGTHRNAAVKFLFGILDANSLRDTFITLLNSRNRAHMAEIIAILEEYIDASQDEQEQVKIFDGCLDIVLSDDTDFSIKHHACNLLSVFFKKVATTELGEVLHKKYVERQVEKAEAVYRYLCSGVSGLNMYFLEDLLRPLDEGGKVYQLKMLTYFRFVIEKIRFGTDVDTVLDTYPDYWATNEPTREDKIQIISRRIMQALEGLWEASGDAEVREQIIRIKYGDYPDKRVLLEQIKGRLDGSQLGGDAQEKISMMLRCFLLEGEEETLKTQAACLLLFRLETAGNRDVALNYFRHHVENGKPEQADRRSVATTMESLLQEPDLEDGQREVARYILFLTDPKRFDTAEEQRDILGYLRGFAEKDGFENQNAEQQVLLALEQLKTIITVEKYVKAAQYLEFKIGQHAADITAPE